MIKKQKKERKNRIGRFITILGNNLHREDKLFTYVEKDMTIEKIREMMMFNLIGKFSEGVISITFSELEDEDFINYLKRDKDILKEEIEKKEKLLNLIKTELSKI